MVYSLSAYSFGKIPRFKERGGHRWILQHHANELELCARVAKGIERAFDQLIVASNAVKRGRFGCVGENLRLQVDRKCSARVP